MDYCSFLVVLLILSTFLVGLSSFWVCVAHFGHFSGGCLLIIACAHVEHFSGGFCSIWACVANFEHFSGGLLLILGGVAHFDHFSGGFLLCVGFGCSFWSVLWWVFAHFATFLLFLVG